MMNLMHDIKHKAIALLRRPTYWWSDLRFRWVVSNKRGLAILSVATVVIVAFTGFFTFYISVKEERRDIVCLALNVYHEARGEPLSGQFAVAEVTLNRVASKNYPNSVCEVVYQQNWDPERKRMISMFSWTEKNESSPIKSDSWEKALQVAELAYSEEYTPKLKGALFFHARYVRPRWAKTKQPKARIGSHIFY